MRGGKKIARMAQKKYQIVSAKNAWNAFLFDEYNFSCLVSGDSKPMSAWRMEKASVYLFFCVFIVCCVMPFYLDGKQWESNE